MKLKLHDIVEFSHKSETLGGRIRRVVIERGGKLAPNGFSGDMDNIYDLKIIGNYDKNPELLNDPPTGTLL